MSYIMFFWSIFSALVFYVAPEGDGISWFQSTSIGVAAAASSFVIEAAAAFTWLEFNAKFFSFHAKLG